MQCIRFDANDVVTGLAQALRESSDTCAEVDQITGSRRVADQTGQVIVVVVRAFERAEEIDPRVLPFHACLLRLFRLKTLYLTIT